MHHLFSTLLVSAGKFVSWETLLCCLSVCLRRIRLCLASILSLFPGLWDRFPPSTNILPLLSQVGLIVLNVMVKSGRVVPFQNTSELTIKHGLWKPKLCNASQGFLLVADPDCSRFLVFSVVDPEQDTKIRLLWSYEPHRTPWTSVSISSCACLSGDTTYFALSLRAACPFILFSSCQWLDQI